MEEEQFNAETFLRFLENVLKRYPTGKIVMVLDSARIHHAKLIQPFLEQHEDRLAFVFLSPFSPQLNPIEGLWKWLKTSVIYNFFIALWLTLERMFKLSSLKLTKSPRKSLIVYVLTYSFFSAFKIYDRFRKCSTTNRGRYS